MKKTWANVVIEELDVGMTLGGSGNSSNERSMIEMYKVTHPEYVQPGREGISDDTIRVDVPDDIWSLWESASNS